MQKYKKLEFQQLQKADIILSTAREHPVSAAIRAATNSIGSGSIIFLVVVLVFLSSGCNFLYRNGFPVPDQPVSGPVTIGPEWVEIIPPKPLKAYDVIQRIDIGYRGYDINKNGSDEKGEILYLKGGKQTRVEAILYDDKGESYELRITSIGGGVGFSRKFTTKTINGEEETIAPDFLTDRTYTKLRMRSEIPLDCEFIKWTGYTNF